jgi:hypothetical protein
MAELEEAKIAQYVHEGIKLLYSSVLYISDIPSYEHSGGGTYIDTLGGDHYDVEKIYVKISGPAIEICTGYNASASHCIDEIRLEDPSSMERFWKILNNCVMVMIDKMVKENMAEIKEAQERVNDAMNQQFTLIEAKTHVVSKMVMNPTIVDFDDLEDLDLVKKYEYDGDEVPF